MRNIKLFLLAFCIISLKEAFAAVPDNDAEVVKYNSHYEVKNDKLVKIDTVLIQINDRSGEKYTNVLIPFAKGEKVTDISGWIEDSFGLLLRKLKSSEITERSSVSEYSLFEDDYVKEFQLKHNTYSYRIGYTFKKTIKNFVAIDWSPIVSYKLVTNSASLTFVAPKGYQTHLLLNKVTKGAVDTIENLVQQTWTATFKEPIRDEIFSAAQEDLVPTVVLVPINFNYGVDGCSRDWKSFGNWQYRLISGLQELPESEKTTVSQLIKGIADKKQIVKILYHYLQDHTRYINVSIGIGGLKPYPATYVAENKYGDCKALSNYMKALLNYAGINSYYTVIYRGRQPAKIDEAIASPSYFNHAILTVPLGNDTIWLDNTNTTTPFGYAGTDIQDRKALLVDKTNSRLINMPVMRCKDVLLRRNMTYQFTEAGNATTDINFTFRGYFFEMVNELKSDYNPTEQNEFIQNYFTPGGHFDVLKWNLQKVDRDSSSINLALRLNLYKVLKSVGDEKYFASPPVGILSFTPVSMRKYDVCLPYPIHHIDSITYKLPDYYVIKTLPENAELQSSYGKYSMRLTSLGNLVVVVSDFELFSNNITLDKYPDFYKFITSVKEVEKSKIVIKKEVLNCRS